MSKEKCVICGEVTPYDVNTHIDQRRSYVEGVGQLCRSCYTGDSSVCVPDSVVMGTPNDQDLGGKIRSLFWKKKSDKIF